MFAKMILPLLGGSPSVWNTCLFFFQATLLIGYAYAHVTTIWLSTRVQVAIHVTLFLLVLLTLRIGVPAEWPSPPIDQNPIPWLLKLLLVGVGMPFFLMSATTPMLQKWFTNTSHPSAKDPYFLYAASNLGSLLALLGYPTLMEPNLRLREQSQAWTGMFGLLVILIFACASILGRFTACTSKKPFQKTSNHLRIQLSSTDNTHGIGVGQKVRWVLLSFAPSSLTFGVTTYLSTDIAPFPLLWVIPLALYLLTFISSFARKTFLPQTLMIQMQPFVNLLLVLSILLDIRRPLWLSILLHLLTFFVNAMVCHQELARTRPAIRYLTEFYLWISVGGMLGGVFNALLAPVVFKTAVEYPVVLVLTYLFRPSPDRDAKKSSAHLLDYGLPSALGVLLAGLLWTLPKIDLKSAILDLGLKFGLPAVACFSFRRRPVRFALGLTIILLLCGLSKDSRDHIEYRERTFFGLYRVKLDPDGKLRGLIHGNIVHGLQNIDANRLEPLSYFYPTSPVGQLFMTFPRPSSKSRVAIIGLGIGSLACYGEHGQQFTFYEIDPAVVRIANDPRYFTFLKDCPPQVEIVIGDARFSLSKAPDSHYGLIILDAFSSDAIPVHLLTREALGLYLKKLANGGILAFHISNNHLDLRSIVGNLASDIGLVSFAQSTLPTSVDEQRRGIFATDWVIMARHKRDLTQLIQDQRWTELQGRIGSRVWTDDFSNILSIIRWK